MRRVLYSIWAVLLLFAVSRTVNFTRNTFQTGAAGPEAPDPGIPSAPAGSPVEKPGGGEILNSDEKLVPRSETPPDLAALGIDVAAFQGITTDPVLIQILATYQPPSEGRVEPRGGGGMALELADGRRFEAPLIGRVRSAAGDGTVAFEALTAEGAKPLREVDKKADGVATEGNPQEIWTISATGRTERISPEGVHAEHPIISPDGRYVAFTARSLVEGMLRPKVLMVRDRVNGRLMSYADRTRGMDYEIKAVDWVEQGSVLRVIDDWGETGGHLKLKEVRLK
jgi:hypothetical protein